MDFATYETIGQAQYARLAATVAAILEVTVRGLPGVRIQQIQHRAKAPGSLEKKIIARGGDLADEVERHAKDVAGCRAVFYTNDDVRAFVSSGVIPDNFEVDWDRTKFHYPQDDADEALFISYNYVVRLKPQRIELPEYADLAGLWCEIQVQSTLDHAWSEMHHDTGYKPPAGGFGTVALTEVKTRMTKIMQDYLLPAGYDFQKVSDDIRRLEKARAFYDTAPLDRIGQPLDNNARHNLIKRFGEEVLPYIDDIDGEAPAIRAALLAAIDRAIETPYEPWRFGDHALPGKTADDVIAAAMTLAENLRYRGEGPVAATWAFIGEVYDRAPSDDARARVRKAAEKLAEQNLHIWKQYGPVVQTELAKLLPAALESPGRSPLVVAAAGAMLASEVKGTTAGFDTITFHEGAVAPSEALAEARAVAMSALETIVFATEGAEQQAAFDALYRATTSPYKATYSLELAKLIDGGSLFVVDVAARLAPSVDLTFRALLERKIFDIRWRLGRRPDADGNADAEAISLHDKLLEALSRFAEEINADSAFTFRKTLVGFNNVTPDDWRRGRLDHKAQREERERAVEALVSACTIDLFERYAPEITAAAAIRSTDGATFLKLDDFLKGLGREQPEFALRLIAEQEEALSSHLAPLLTGLALGPRRADRDALISNMINENRHIAQVLDTTWRTANDIAQFDRAAKQALANGDEYSLLLLIDFASRAAKDRQEVIGELLIPAIREAAQIHPDRWLNQTWFMWNDGFAGAFSEPEIDAVLEVLVSVTKIETHAEWILAEVARIYPLKVLDVFDRRMEAGRRGDAGERLEPIPFSLHELNVPLAEHPGDVVAHVRAWFEHDPELFEYSGGQFMHGVFSDLAPAEASLRPFAEGTEDDRRFLAKVLGAYDGSPTIDSLSRDLVAASTEGSATWEAVDLALDKTGVVSGDFGFVEAYIGKKAAMEAWLEDERAPVRRFAELRIPSLERQISGERRQRIEAFNLRKRRYEKA